MVKVKTGIIGGTGVGRRIAEMGGKTLYVPTAFGVLKGALLRWEGVDLMLIERHSASHKVPPHLVNYRAMADGLRRLGAQSCLSSAAVGALHAGLKPGDFLVCSDFIDLSGRNSTLFDRAVRHTDFSEPMGGRARSALMKAVAGQGARPPEKTVYACSNGPRYETPFEVSAYAAMGADVVGMTAATEAVLMREAGIDYACLAIVTNLAAGVGQAPLSHGEVSAQMQESGKAAVDILLRAAKDLR